MAADFKTTMMNGLKVIYTPDTALKTHIEDSITYEQDRVKAKNGGSAGGDVEDPTEEEAPHPML